MMTFLRDEREVPFMTFTDALSTVTIADIQAYGTNMATTEIESMMKQYRQLVDSVVSQITMGTPNPGSEYLFRRYMETGEVVVARSGDIARTAYVDKLSHVLGYNGELETERVRPPHQALITYSVQSEANIPVITVYHPLPLSPRITSFDGNVWQLARYQSRGPTDFPSNRGVNLIRLPASH